MAVPKRRMSRANTRSRRAQWKAKRPELVNVTVAGQQHKVPRRLPWPARSRPSLTVFRRPIERRASQVTLR